MITLEIANEIKDGIIISLGKILQNNDSSRKKLFLIIIKKENICEK